MRTSASRSPLPWNSLEADGGVPLRQAYRTVVQPTPADLRPRSSRQAPVGCDGVRAAAPRGTHFQPLCRYADRNIRIRRTPRSRRRRTVPPIPRPRPLPLLPAPRRFGGPARGDHASAVAHRYHGAGRERVPGSGPAGPAGATKSTRAAGAIHETLISTARVTAGGTGAGPLSRPATPDSDPPASPGAPGRGTRSDRSRSARRAPHRR